MEHFDIIELWIQIIILELELIFLFSMMRSNLGEFQIIFITNLNKKIIT